MYNFLLKHGQKIFFALGVIVLGVMFANISGGVDDFNLVQEAVALDSTRKPELYKTSMFNAGITLTLWLLRLAVAALVLFGLYHVVTNLKSSSKGLIYFALLAIIAVGAYYSVDPDAVSTTIRHALDKFAKASGTPITPSNYKVIVGGITTALLLLVGNAAAFLFGEIRNFFK